MIPVVYHPCYNITAFGLERLHPFDGRKYRRIHDALIERGLRRSADFVRPKKVSRRELLEVHVPDYLRSLRSSETLARILEVPVVRRLPESVIDWRILRPMRYAVGGTILASRLALEQGVAINLGGGFHHAAAAWGGGFCVYADIPLAAKILHDEGLARKVLVVDLDAHQGNGTAAVFQDWPWAVDLRPLRARHFSRSKGARGLRDAGRAGPDRRENTWKSSRTNCPLPLMPCGRIC